MNAQEAALISTIANGRKLTPRFAAKDKATENISTADATFEIMLVNTIVPKYTTANAMIGLVPPI
jgi:hypothetical protein